MESQEPAERMKQIKTALVKEVSLTIVVCHEVPEIEVTVHLSHMQLFVVLRTTRGGDLHKLLRGRVNHGPGNHAYR